ncbi:MAG: DNA-directed RNA polymerase subunit omega [Candidatus Omnitrophica bacterium]|nr:DNA-directed RNA polymerase subunit omega [Candidatus Omnitrophota bacterium]
MPYVPLETLLDKTNNSVYKLVVVAAKRSLEIAEGQPSLIQVDKSLKPGTIALKEIAAGKVRLKSKTKKNEG